MNLFARLISIVASPLVITAPIAFALVYKGTSDTYYALTWTVVSMLFAVTVALFVLYGVRRGFFSDFDISIREQRKPVFVFAGLVAIFYFLAIFFLKGPIILMATLGAFMLGILFNSFINTRIKSSIHLAVFSSFVTVLGFLYGGLFWVLALFIPLVAWSRITLKRHTLQETIAGTLLGLILVIVLYYLVNYFII